jgi:hypothetical protein
MPPIDASGRLRNDTRVRNQLLYIQLAVPVH